MFFHNRVRFWTWSVNMYSVTYCKNIWLMYSVSTKNCRILWCCMKLSSHCIDIYLFMYTSIYTLHVSSKYWIHYIQVALKLYKSIVLLVHIQINMELHQFQWLWFKYDMLHELKMKLNSAKQSTLIFLGTAVLTHHSAYNLIVSINMYSYVYHIITIWTLTMDLMFIGPCIIVIVEE